MPTQREYMRKLVIEHGADRDMVCAEYARAERDGVVIRNMDANQTGPEDYALALWKDGLRRGWLKDDVRFEGDVCSTAGESDELFLKKLKSSTVAQLLVLHAQIVEEMRERGVMRSANNPTGELAEYLFCRAFGWRQEPNSKRGYDAVGENGTRYQIKGRRVHRRNKSRQLSAIRDITGGHFDVLAGVLFDDDFHVVKAALVPISYVVERSTYVARTNSNKFMLRDDVWAAPGVRDVTADIAAAMP